MKKLAAVTGMTLQSSLGSASVVNFGSTKANVGGNAIFIDKVQALVSGAVNGTCEQTAPVQGDITASSTKTKLENKAICREGDKLNSLTITGVDKFTGVACSFTVSVEIKQAGQNKVFVE